MDDKNTPVKRLSKRMKNRLDELDIMSKLFSDDELLYKLLRNKDLFKTIVASLVFWLLKTLIERLFL
jgi:hypothetical protein